ncbi:MAG TPA: SDR family NAD(P)-dependent oxidoreductase, partial [Polyangiaceae bacterium]|nr:SDR family NAD(P)-dependent oxidoreductase [Polyangiaceae bacterium]
MAKIVITGATGTIGQEVARALLEAKEDVRILARDPSKVSELQRLGAEVVAGDLDDQASLERALQGAERLFLLTGFVESCVPQVRNAVEAAKAAGVRFILRMSAAGADPNSQFSLAKHHGESEDLVKGSGLAWAVIRPNFFMDNLLNYAGA